MFPCLAKLSASFAGNTTELLNVSGCPPICIDLYFAEYLLIASLPPYEDVTHYE
jgi:hypothetical protein